MKKVYEVPECEILLLDMKQVSMEIQCVVSEAPNDEKLFPDAPNFGDFENNIDIWN